jgi:hypothetical protein
MEENLGLALASIFGRSLLDNPTVADLAGDGTTEIGGAPSATAGPGDTGSSETTGDDVPQLILEANRQFEAAQEAARQGDWAGYGRELDALAATLERLGALVAPTPAPAPVEPVSEQTAPEATPTAP